MSIIVQNHYVLAVHSLEKSSRFFVDLGFKVTSEPPGWIFVEKDNCMIMLGECQDAIRPGDLGDHSYFGYLRVDDADSYYHDLKVKGVEIISPISDKPWGMREFGVRSPEGHRLMIGHWIGP
ncbi:MAG: VOC family protein [Acidobacteria bacterium]|nr:VOC family protein [Acidobacteriota bacterium]